MYRHCTLCQLSDAISSGIAKQAPIHVESIFFSFIISFSFFFSLRYFVIRFPKAHRLIFYASRFAWVLLSVSVFPRAPTNLPFSPKASRALLYVRTNHFNWTLVGPILLRNSAKSILSVGFVQLQLMRTRFSFAPLMAILHTYSIIVRHAIYGEFISFLVILSKNSLDWIASSATKIKFIQIIKNWDFRMTFSLFSREFQHLLFACVKSMT